MIRQIVFSGWNLMRWLRLGIGSYFLISGLRQPDNLMALIGGFFLFQAIFNVGCCGSGGCGVNTSSRGPQGTPATDVEYEEIKSN
ncbi:MAG: hypothetical protein ACYCOO_05055 [Chitinophagaceae bacterium]